MIIERKLFKHFLHRTIYSFELDSYPSTKIQILACFAVCNCYGCLLQHLFEQRDSSCSLLIAGVMSSYLPRFIYMWCSVGFFIKQVQNF